MELKATSLGKHLAQHPYNRVKLLNAGVQVSGEKHEYVIPFNQLLDIQCKRGLVWGELEFVLPDNQVVRLHGTEWQETQQFYRYLMKMWRQWSDDMSAVCADALQRQVTDIEQMTNHHGWVSRQALAELQTAIRATLASLPLPAARLTEFVNCCDSYTLCQQWLAEGESCRTACNQAWMEKTLSSEQAFFDGVETTPLNVSQCRAVINGEDSVLVLAGAGSGKTSVLVARAAWLLHRNEAMPEQILLLAFGRKAAQEMNQRIQERLHTDAVQAKTFHALALHIIQHATRKAPVISRLESDGAQRHELLIKTWQQQCAEKKAQAKGWREWLSEEMAWNVPDGEFWLDTRLAARLSGRLDRWLGLMRMQGGSQSDMLALADDEQRPRLQRGLRLMAPLLKAWKAALKEEGAVDFSGLIHQAVNLLDKGRFISPWKHILVDEFQDISPQRAQLLAALRRQNLRTCLFAVGDDWQAIYRFSGAELTLTTAFEHHFGRGERCALDTTYRFNDRIGEIANTFVQQNPHQLKKPLNSLRAGDKKAVMLLPETQLEALFDKLSSYVTPDEHILVLARYHHLRPAMLDKASVRWPNLAIDFMTIHASKGQQADYVVIVGLNDGKEGFPALSRESLLEQVLLPQPEPFADAEERRLLYVALTRAKHRVWLLYDREAPSVFVEQLQRVGVPLQRKP
ncbi:DNA helicase IV [Candidatus Symbiopectobacterium sp. NZEC127]|uniref:DNA helicase IV n=1 Tax=Candidatus Symbiopectobacterium sp. NZEC127 TaxID=2820472 RepID=UPI002226DB13|nr:DNA helicase IV [Candidatus Symbiopectobacterium sp. NZEC127]MCW2485574.1 DNA helicase IV [Candidatus Symbiopectobacterium sp. NZEC127]